MEMMMDGAEKPEVTKNMLRAGDRVLRVHLEEETSWEQMSDEKVHALLREVFSSMVAAR